MKTLILIRHGKSSRKTDLQDHDRPLKKRAFQDALLVSQAFQIPDRNKLRIWSSSAKRALGTAQIFREELQIASENFVVKKELYTFNPEELLEVIYTAKDSLENLIIFGHNPAITAVANMLGDNHFDHIPTTGLVQLEFNSDSWTNLKQGRTRFHFFPKNLK